MISERELFIAIVDNDLIQKSDAIILLEGDGLNRYQHAVNLYKKGYAKTIVFSGGAINYHYGSYPFSDIKPYILKAGVPESSIIHESVSLHTQQQGVEVIRLCQNHKWNSIILVGSHYHQYRAYLTFLKAMIDAGNKIRIYNSPASQLEWFSENDWGSRINCLYDEFEKIDLYLKKGHIASFEEAIKYQEWKERCELGKYG